MAGLNVHFLPEATILSEDEMTFVQGPSFIGFQIPSNHSSSATESVSCGNSLSGLVSLWLIEILSGK